MSAARGREPHSSRRNFKISSLPWLILRLGRAKGGRAAGVLSIWLWVERFFERRWRLQPVRPHGVLRYQLTVHRGRPVTLRDGTAVRPGDRIVELHFNNRNLLEMTGAADWNPWHAMQSLEADLDALAGMAVSGSLGDARAMHGVTLFALPGRRLGFEVHTVPHTWTWGLRRFFLVGLLPIYHRQGWKEFDRMRQRRWPGELWMSIERLTRRLASPRRAAS